MLLYHGTASSNLSSILAEGLLPRSQSGQSSHWDGHQESYPEFVYLSKSLDWRYAYASAYRCGLSSDPMMVEVNVGNGRLYPDEDWVRAQVAMESGVSLPEHPKKRDIEKFQKAALDAAKVVTPDVVRSRRTRWADSLREHGGVAHDGAVELKQVRRIIVLSGEYVLGSLKYLDEHLGGLGHHGEETVARAHEAWHRYWWGECRALTDVPVVVDIAVDGVSIGTANIPPLPDGCRRVITLRKGEVVDDRGV